MCQSHTYLDRLARLNQPILSNGRARGDMIEVFKATSNIYDTKVTKFVTYRDHTDARGSQIKKMYQHFCSCIQHNFFSSAYSKLGIRCLKMR